MAKDYQASFEYTMKDGRPVTVYCSDWQSGEPDVNIGPGYENVWAEDSDDHEIELTDDQFQELYDQAGKMGWPEEEDWI